MTELGEIPEDWEIVKLSSVAKCSVGIASSATHAYRKSGVLLIRNQNIKEGKIDLIDALFISEKYELQHKSKRLLTGDILTVRTGYPGISAVVPEKLSGSQSFTTLITRIYTEKLESQFLCNFINSDIGKSFFRNNQAGGGQQNVGSKTLENLILPIPSIKEQQKIANILTTVDEKIAVIEAKIIQTQELKKGLMQQLLTRGIGHTKFKTSELGEIPESWEVTKLGNVIEKIIGGGTPFRENEKFWGREIPWATVKDLKKSKLDNTGEYITEFGLRNSSSNLIPKDTLIIATRMALGKAVFFSLDVAINQDLKAIISKQNASKYFLFHWFLANATMIASMGSGSTVKGIRLEVLKNILFALPSKFEQEHIASILTMVDEKLEVLQAKKENFTTLKKGLMQQLLTGKLRVTC